MMYKNEGKRRKREERGWEKKGLNKSKPFVPAGWKTSSAESEEDVRTHTPLDGQRRSKRSERNPFVPMLFKASVLTIGTFWTTDL